MSSAENPTIVVVQGSFQTSLVYEGLEKGLQSNGYPTVHPTLPSCSNTDSPDFPSITLADDAAVVRREVTRLVEENKTIVLVMHSYGGLVGNEAVPEGLSKSNRQSQGLRGGVIYLFMFAAFVIEEGKSVLDAFGESPNNDVKPDGRFFMKNGAQLIYNDLPASEASLWESKMIPQSYSVQGMRMTRAAYKYIPSIYLICENDQAAPPQYQEMFAKMASSQVERCSVGHSPMLSQMEMLVGKIVNAVKAIAGTKPYDGSETELIHQHQCNRATAIFLSEMSSKWEPIKSMGHVSLVFESTYRMSTTALRPGSVITHYSIAVNLCCTSQRGLACTPISLRCKTAREVVSRTD